MERKGSGLKKIINGYTFQVNYEKGKARNSGRTQTTFR